MRSRVISIAAVFAVVTSLALVQVVGAYSGKPAGFAGSWTAIDCATGDNQGQWGMDCSVWGDASTLTLHVTKGDAPRFVYQDAYSTECAMAGSAATRLVVTGSGYYATNEWDQTFFIPITTVARCGNLVLEGYDLGGIYWDEGSDSLWAGDPDGDGWGISWGRAH